MINLRYMEKLLTLHKLYDYEKVKNKKKVGFHVDQCIFLKIISFTSPIKFMTI